MAEKVAFAGPLIEIDQLGLPQSGGLYAAIEILENIDRESEKSIIGDLETGDPELAAEIRKRLTTFEDIIRFDDESIQRIVSESEDSDIAHALKGCGADVEEKILAGMPEDRAGRIREEMDRLGPVILRDVEEAQTRIIMTVRTLEEAGEIVREMPGEERLVAD